MTIKPIRDFKNRTPNEMELINPFQISVKQAIKEGRYDGPEEFLFFGLTPINFDKLRKKNDYLSPEDAAFLMWSVDPSDIRIINSRNIFPFTEIPSQEDVITPPSGFLEEIIKACHSGELKCKKSKIDKTFVIKTCDFLLWALYDKGWSMPDQMYKSALKIKESDLITKGDKAGLKIFYTDHHLCKKVINRRLKFYKSFFKPRQKQSQAKTIFQNEAKMLWDNDPELIQKGVVTQIIKKDLDYLYKNIEKRQKYTFGTLTEWAKEVDPRRKSKRMGRPKKTYKTT